MTERFLMEQRDVDEWRNYVLSYIVGGMAHIKPEFMTRADFDFDFQEQLDTFLLAIHSDWGNRPRGLVEKYKRDYINRVKSDEIQMHVLWTDTKILCEKACKILRDEIGIKGAHIENVDDVEQIIELSMYI